MKPNKRKKVVKRITDKERLDFLGRKLKWDVLYVLKVENSINLTFRQGIDAAIRQSKRKG
jgi:hypothetical protein